MAAPSTEDAASKYNTILADPGAAWQFKSSSNIDCYLALYPVSVDPSASCSEERTLRDGRPLRVSLCGTDELMHEPVDKLRWLVEKRFKIGDAMPQEV